MSQCSVYNMCVFCRHNSESVQCVQHVRVCFVSTTVSQCHVLQNVCVCFVGTTVSRCSVYNMCANGAGWYCPLEKCNRKWDCEDGSDEHGCWINGTKQCSVE